MFRVLRVFCLFAACCLAACNPFEESFALPEGDADRGRQHFVSLGCINCHVVTGAELPAPAEAGPVQVRLGSRTGRKMSYGQLVTAIVNPSHRLPIGHERTGVSVDGQSRMTSLNDVLTITQLTDIVTFLQAHYTEAERPGYTYPVYDYLSRKDQGGSNP